MLRAAADRIIHYGEHIHGQGMVCLIHLLSVEENFS